MIKFSKIINKNRLIPVFLVYLSFFLFNGAEFLHHHSDFHKRENCEICKFTNTLAKSNFESKSYNLITICFGLILKESNFPPASFQYYSNFSGRSPPYNS